VLAEYAFQATDFGDPVESINATFALGFVVEPKAVLYTSHIDVAGSTRNTIHGVELVCHCGTGLCSFLNVQICVLSQSNHVNRYENNDALLQ
jgi:hypothetical protein